MRRKRGARQGYPALLVSTYVYCRSLPLLHPGQLVLATISSPQRRRIAATVASLDSAAGVRSALVTRRKHRPRGSARTERRADRLTPAVLKVGEVQRLHVTRRNDAKISRGERYLGRSPTRYTHDGRAPLSRQAQAEGPDMRREDVPRRFSPEMWVTIRDTGRHVKIESWSDIAGAYRVRSAKRDVLFLTDAELDDVIPHPEERLGRCWSRCRGAACGAPLTAGLAICEHCGQPRCTCGRCGCARAGGAAARGRLKTERRRAVAKDR